MDYVDTSISYKLFFVLGIRFVPFILFTKSCLSPRLNKSKFEGKIKPKEKAQELLVESKLEHNMESSRKFNTNQGLKTLFEPDNQISQYEIYIKVLEKQEPEVVAESLLLLDKTSYDLQKLKRPLMNF